MPVNVSPTKRVTTDVHKRNGQSSFKFCNVQSVNLSEDVSHKDREKSGNHNISRAYILMIVIIRVLVLNKKIVIYAGAPWTDHKVLR